MAINWQPIYERFRGRWVALEQDEETVISDGATAKEAWDRARALGRERPILTRMPDELVSYVGC